MEKSRREQFIYCVCVSAAQSCLTLCDPMDYIARQAPLSMELSRQEYWSGASLPFSRGSSRPRDQTQVSYTAGRVFTI